MNRRVFLHLSGPGALLGVLLVAAAIGSVWSIHRLQRNLTSILAENVTCLEAAQELEINLRQLRFHSFMNLMDPRPSRVEVITEAQQGFEAALRSARRHTVSAEEVKLLDNIEKGYAEYRKELEDGPRPMAGSVAEYVQWADLHPVRHLQGPCEELLQVNKLAMEATANESEAVVRQTRLAVLGLGILGPICGLIVGAMVARTWSHSIAHLSVRLQDMHARLGDEVSEVVVDFNQDWVGINRQLDGVVERVKSAAALLQRQEREILRAEQLAAVGQLAASLAHEIRNPLTAIKMLIGIARSSRSMNALTEQDLDIIFHEVGKLEHTVQGLLDYAKPPRLNFCDADLRRIVQNAVVLTRARAEQRQVAISLDAPAEEMLCRIDPGQIGNVVVNLLINAVDAMPEGGRISISIDRGDDGTVTLVVEDDGPGIAPEMVDRLFEPFASTKPTGTGLGLSICRRIVRDHNGAIAHESRPGGGSRFIVTLFKSGFQQTETADATLVSH